MTMRKPSRNSKTRPRITQNCRQMRIRGSAMQAAAQARPVCRRDLARSLRRSTNVATFLLFCRKSRHHRREISLKLLNDWRNQHTFSPDDETYVKSLTDEMSKCETALAKNNE